MEKEILLFLIQVYGYYKHLLFSIFDMWMINDIIFQFIINTHIFNYSIISETNNTFIQRLYNYAVLNSFSFFKYYLEW